MVTFAFKEAIANQETLNPKLWNEDATLKQDIKEKLLRIADDFITNSEILNKDDIIDIELVGSNASYNYHSKSDIDVHIIVDMSEISTDDVLVQVATNLEKANFNKDLHPTVKGMDVEVYVEDINASAVSNGVYSLKKNEWVKFPKKIVIPNYEDDPDYKSRLEVWIEQAKKAINDSQTSTEVKEFINSLYNLRRVSIMTDGEYAKGNFIFKDIRDKGLLQQLKDKRDELRSKELSLESVKYSLTHR